MAYDFDIEYVKGNSIPHVCALSRLRFYDRMAAETRHDPVLIRISSRIRKHIWGNCSKEIRHKLTIEHGVICNGDLIILCPVGWGCRIHRLLLSNECPEYDTKQSDGEVPVMLELWGMQSIPLLQSLPGPFWPSMVAPDKGPIYGLNRTKLWFLEFTVFGI